VEPAKDPESLLQILSPARCNRTTPCSSTGDDDAAWTMWKTHTRQRVFQWRGGRPFACAPAVHGAGIVHRRAPSVRVTGRRTSRAPPLRLDLGADIT